MDRLTKLGKDGKARLDFEAIGVPFGKDTVYDIVDLYHIACARLAELEDAEEQRNKGCEYCLQEETMAYGEDSMKRSAYIYLDGNLLTADLYSDSMAVAICFCPMCGRKLKEG